ncbi:MAG: signal peptidase I [Verrucomicrobia bacterium]|nr:signal peptidase I [Verrucomicrobiota bacterium]
MKFLRRITIGVACLVAAYYTCFGLLYFAGYRVYRFPTAAMQPTIMKGEKAIGRLSESYRNKVARFDIVIHRSRFEGSEEIYGKRAIGLPGEHIVIGPQGVIVDGRKLTLPSPLSIVGLHLKPCDVRIPRDAVFVLGDNTANSADSRYHGPIPLREVIGYMVFKK